MKDKYKKAVKTRMERGSYKHSEEQKKKISNPETFRDKFLKGIGYFVIINVSLVLLLSFFKIIYKNFQNSSVQYLLYYFLISMILILGVYIILLQNEKNGKK
ncbi:MAG: hypothetical protein PHS54_01290 [Clostridia bacterium]|nr:hypothetical protein [Clostridia bacterium]